MEHLPTQNYSKLKDVNISLPYRYPVILKKTSLLKPSTETSIALISFDQRLSFSNPIIPLPPKGHQFCHVCDSHALSFRMSLGCARLLQMRSPCHVFPPILDDKLWTGRSQNTGLNGSFSLHQHLSITLTGS